MIDTVFVQVECSSEGTRQDSPFPEGIRCHYRSFLSWFNLQSTSGRPAVVAEGIIAFNVAHNSINGVFVVHLSGAIFFDEESTFLRIKCEGPVGQIASNRVGFRESHSIDSSGLGTLGALHVSARKIGGNIKLANLGYHIKEALPITRLVTVFDIFDTTGDAVASFNRAAAAG